MVRGDAGKDGEIGANLRTPNSVKDGRFAKARQFTDAADLVRMFQDDRDVRDAYGTLLIHAAIAASDVICIADLGYHAKGDDHNQAVEVLAKAADGPKLSAALARALRVKTKAGYSHQPLSSQDVKQIERATAELLAAAQQRM